AAATTENDVFTFEEVNDGAPVVPNEGDTTGHRDPYILRSHDGDRYYMIATDLCIGCGTGWDEAQSSGSLKVNGRESTAMGQREAHRRVRTRADPRQPARGRHDVGARGVLERRPAALRAVLRLPPLRRRGPHRRRGPRPDVRRAHA